MSNKMRIFCIAVILASVSMPAQAVVDPDLPRQADLMVLGIVLDHPESAKNAFGLKLEPEDPDAIHLRMALCNQDKHEKLVLSFYERDIAIIISELQVERVHTPHADCIVPPQYIAHFMSGKGVHLGMSRNEVVRILGNGYVKHPHPDEQVISYRIDNKDSPVLQRHNVPAYYGQYHFKENRLVKFVMGFELP